MTLLNQLIQSVIDRDLDKVIHLIDKRGVDINGRDTDNGATALHEAAYYGYHDIVTALLDRGADKNVSDDEGNTPLHYAELQGQTGVEEVLRETRKHGAE